MTELATITPHHQVGVPLAETAQKAQAYLDSARARNTIRGYRSSFGQFQRWCEASRLSTLPASPETISLYVAAQAGRLKAATLGHHLAAIAKAHKTAGLPSPVRDNQLIAETMKGIKRTHGSAQQQKSPVLTEDLRMMLRLVPSNLLGIRDRALLLIGFTGAFRRSELVALEVSDLTFTTEGVLINLRRSKTDQEGEGRKVAIPFGHNGTCPVNALRTWLTAAAITEGPVFRQVAKWSTQPLSDQSVALIVKRYAVAAGMDASDFAGHSLRAGFVTSAARAGEPERKIMRQTGHKSMEMVLKYVRNANQFTDNAALALGL